MKKSITLLLILIFTYSCSKDSSDNLSGKLSLSGKFVTPNGIDAVAKASVKLYDGSTLVKESVTDSKGEFTLNKLTPGEYDLKISKGLFKASRTVTLEDIDDIIDFVLENIVITDIPNIAVVTGNYDNIETVLYDIGLVDPLTQEPLFDIIDGQDISGRSHENGHHHSDVANRPFNPQLNPNTDFGFGEFIQSPELLSNYDIIFLNCGLSEDRTQFSNNLNEYVSNGGLLYSTDYAFVYLDDITNNGEDYIDFYEPHRTGSSLSTEAEIFNPELLDWLTLNFDITITNNTVTIDQFLADWQVVDTYDVETTIPWLNGIVNYNGITESKYLAYTFLHVE
jgi:hypothetical protein